MSVLDATWVKEGCLCKCVCSKWLSIYYTLSIFCRFIKRKYITSFRAKVFQLFLHKQWIVWGAVEEVGAAITTAWKGTVYKVEEC